MVTTELKEGQTPQVRIVDYSSMKIQTPYSEMIDSLVNPQSRISNRPSPFMKKLSDDLIKRYPEHAAKWTASEADYNRSLSYISTHIKRPLDLIYSLSEGDLSGKTILDLGCGAVSGTEDVRWGPLFFSQPWLARALTELGARVIGVDVGDISREPFETKVVDMLDENSLHFIPDNSVDVAHAAGVFCSPELSRRAGDYNHNGSRIAETKLRKIIDPQLQRILKPGAPLLRYDWFL